MSANTGSRQRVTLLSSIVKTIGLQPSRLGVGLPWVIPMCYIWTSLIALLAPNFLFDYLLLWATGEVSGNFSNKKRLSLGALLGALYFLLVYFARLEFIPGYGYLRFPVTILAVGGGMIWVAFRPQTWRKFLSLLGFFVGIGLVAGGAGVATAYVTGDGMSPNPIWGTLMAIAAILLIAELGWGVVHRRLWEKVYYVPIEIGIGGRKTRINALVDTGNRLRDPLTRQSRRRC